MSTRMPILLFRIVHSMRVDLGAASLFSPLPIIPFGNRRRLPRQAHKTKQSNRTSGQIRKATKISSRWRALSGQSIFDGQRGDFGRVSNCDGSRFDYGYKCRQNVPYLAHPFPTVQPQNPSSSHDGFLQSLIHSDQSKNTVFGVSGSQRVNPNSALTHPLNCHSLIVCLLLAAPSGFADFV